MNNDSAYNYNNILYYRAWKPFSPTKLIDKLKDTTDYNTW